MTDITIPYEEDTLSGNFTYDITNNNARELSVFISGLSAGTIAFYYMLTSGPYLLKTYSADADDVITITNRKVRIVGTGVTAAAISLT